MGSGYADVLDLGDVPSLDSDSDLGISANPYSDIKCLEKITREEIVRGKPEDKLIRRIFYLNKGGKIVIEAERGRLYAYSVGIRQRYKHTYDVTKIGQSINPEQAIAKAEEDIISRLRYFEGLKIKKENPSAAAPEQLKIVKPEKLEEAVETVRFDDISGLEIEGVAVIGIAS
ncbi:MAG: hypothetical protein PHH00_02975 [Candidatus Nanoarchaeia archaeon]|nr:hypothetical protein [Candidatus Nanoarchaeia archaeon]